MTDVFSIPSPFPLPTEARGHRTVISFAILTDQLAALEASRENLLERLFEVRGQRFSVREDVAYRFIPGITARR